MAILSRRDDPDARSRGETALIEAAIALMEEGEPYASVTVAAITSRAGHTRTAFYFYFRDKRDLLMAATDRLVGGLFDDTDHWWSGGDREALETTLRAILQDYRRSSALIRALVEATSYDRVVADYWHGEIERFIEATEARLPPAYAPPTRRGVASALVWMIERTYYLRILDEDTAGDAVAVDALLEVWARTLGLGD
ncbi:unannotated protein [freshwater metagenome]|jgi:TetR/AcrR family transcriptional regulator, ethionamide resistance regulator|uniref:Unannotated protein n=1 Tax=freshwater metagenome TaxID=449393 RepID=A0A6J7JQB3_9ZZZZ|nr:TetR family transcriptional regulator [Actinomycetota bacterium]